jgi:hypothetical protein
MKNSIYKRLQPIEKLAVVNARLRHGDMTKVAKKTGVSSTTVTSVIEGRKEDMKVLNAAYNITRSRKKNFQVIKQLTKKIVPLGTEG